MLHLLLAEAMRLGDKEMIEAFGPSGASAGGSTRDLQEEAAVPPALIGLVAQRGQTGLLERLLKLSKLTEKKPAVKPAILATTKKTDKEKTAVLQQCLNALLEAALAAGDGEAVACLLPSYDLAVTEGHLQPVLPYALPAFAALAARRGEMASLAALKKAGAVEWTKACTGEWWITEQLGVHERMDCLSHLQAPPPPLPPPLTTSMTAASAQSPPKPAEGLLREGGNSLVPGVHQPREAIVLAAKRGDEQTLMHLLAGTVDAHDVRRVAQAGDLELLAALIGTDSAPPPNPAKDEAARASLAPTAAFLSPLRPARSTPRPGSADYHPSTRPGSAEYHSSRRPGSADYHSSRRHASREQSEEDELLRRARRLLADGPRGDHLAPTRLGFGSSSRLGSLADGGLPRRLPGGGATSSYLLDAGHPLYLSTAHREPSTLAEVNLGLASYGNTLTEINVSLADCGVSKQGMAHGHGHTMPHKTNTMLGAELEAQLAALSSRVSSLRDGTSYVAPSIPGRASPSRVAPPLQRPAPFGGSGGLQSGAYSTSGQQSWRQSGGLHGSGSGATLGSGERGRTAAGWQAERSQGVALVAAAPGREVVSALPTTLPRYQGLDHAPPDIRIPRPPAPAWRRDWESEPAAAATPTTTATATTGAGGGAEAAADEKLWMELLERSAGLAPLERMAHLDQHSHLLDAYFRPKGWTPTKGAAGGPKAARRRPLDLGPEPTAAFEGVDAARDSEAEQLLRTELRTEQASPRTEQRTGQRSGQRAAAESRAAAPRHAARPSRPQQVAPQVQLRVPPLLSSRAPPVAVRGTATGQPPAPFQGAGQGVGQGVGGAAWRPSRPAAPREAPSCSLVGENEAWGTVRGGRAAEAAAERSRMDWGRAEWDDTQRASTLSELQAQQRDFEQQAPWLCGAPAQPARSTGVRHMR